ncbi:carboxypeptidase-like regulatory domain-containing protein [Paludibaculum fermentans]|uniref:Carboxypeptidase regulatory-like domain-containing protein n=1 Tax=Paludibaculum fermentans TaxID=1473598 RepID=A0A7S7SJI0_PALFE|nr:carboxypeptidase-like regulatory domain-containing protein [Paludibaculum fermentans]QOY88102.1 carboxypeptidase regulatory-like domain-containing protein [Paludibaculum fermentans]
MVRYQTAAILLILAARTAAAQPERNSSIAGRVVNAVTGAPLRRAAVTIVLDGRDDVRGMAPTDADGQFLLRLLPAGRYRIEVSKPGYAVMNYGARFPSNPGQIVTVGPNENKSGLIVRLPQLGAISGSIVAAGGGPAKGAFVQAYRRIYRRGQLDWSPEGSARANNAGQYRIIHLPAGYYIVSARQREEIADEKPGPVVSLEPAPRQVPALTFHPATPARGEAAPILLGTASEAMGINVSIQEMEPIRLSLPFFGLPGGNSPLVQRANGALTARPFIPARIREVNGESGYHLQIATGPERRFETLALAPGRYVITSATEATGVLYSARQEVNLTGGTLDVPLYFRPAPSVKGRIRLEGPNGGALSRMSVRLSGSEIGILRMESAKVQPDGSFSIPAVAAGVWDLAVDAIPPGGHVKSALLGRTDVLNGGLLVSNDNRDPLEIVVSTVSAQLRGRVDDRRATVVLAAPQGERAGRPRFFFTAGLDEDASFEFRALPPGAYTIYAFEELAPQAWLDPEFLPHYAGLGTPVELREGRAPEIAVKTIVGSTATRRVQ